MQTTTATVILYAYVCILPVLRPDRQTERESDGKREESHVREFCTCTLLERKHVKSNDDKIYGCLIYGARIASAYRALRIRYATTCSAV